jgi:hypothetical protein
MYVEKLPFLFPFTLMKGANVAMLRVDGKQLSGDRVRFAKVGFFLLGRKKLNLEIIFLI